MQYKDSSAWREALEKEALLPEGFQVAVGRCQYIPAEKPDAGEQVMNLAVLRTEEPSSSFGAVFTKNAFPGWPVYIGRELLDEPEIQGVVVNNRIANVGAAGGMEDSRLVAAQAARVFGDDAPYLPSSTGVIGWKLPVKAMVEGLSAIDRENPDKTVLPFAEAIMTTDAWPKVRSQTCGTGRIVGCAKGAGMVEPNMATMLSFLITDLDVPREACRTILEEVADSTFNRITVDGETSTSDTVVLLSSRRRPYPGDADFRHALSAVAGDLAEDVVRNGEGCGHVFRVSITGAPNESVAVALARSVANAPLTKTAIRGNDPNVGRILQALGSAAGRLNIELARDQLVLEIGDRKVYDRGSFHLDGNEEAALSRYLKSAELPLPTPDWPAHHERIEITLNLGPGGSSASVIGSDLSEEYIKINADYRT